jgi:hypothetical protein
LFLANYYAKKIQLLQLDITCDSQDVASWDVGVLFSTAMKVFR